MLGGWKVEGVSELSDLILQSAQAPGISRRPDLGRDPPIRRLQALNILRFSDDFFPFR